MQQHDQRETSARLRAGASVHNGPDANHATWRPEEAPTAPVAIEPSPGSPRRAGRGFVESYGLGRVCGVLGCTTRLSQYNRASACSLHDEGNNRAVHL
jgi:hypothetical protein